MGNSAAVMGNDPFPDYDADPVIDPEVAAGRKTAAQARAELQPPAQDAPAASPSSPLVMDRPNSREEAKARVAAMLAGRAAPAIEILGEGSSLERPTHDVGECVLEGRTPDPHPPTRKPQKRQPGATAQQRMAARRQRDPESARATEAAYRDRNRETYNARKREAMAARRAAAKAARRQRP